MNKQQTADDLRAAARYIEKHGWTQFHLESDDGSVCASGALEKVTNFLPDFGIRYGNACLTLRNYLRNVLHIEMGVGGWNDCRGRTKEEVMETLEKAAAWFEEQA